jgi:hypothetical protein
MGFLLWGMKWLFHPIIWRKKLMDSTSGNLGYIITGHEAGHITLLWSGCG